MTTESAALLWKVVSEPQAFLITLGGPRAHNHCVENIFAGRFFGCRFLSSLFDVPVESEIHSEGDNDDAIHDADDPQGI